MIEVASLIAKELGKKAAEMAKNEISKKLDEKYKGPGNYQIKVNESIDKMKAPESDSVLTQPEKKEIRHISTRNENLEGKNHPVTNVPFARKTIEYNNEKVEGVFPKFESDFDAQLPPDKYKSSDAVQNAESNKQLKNKVESDPEFAKKFSKEQLEQIKNGQTPEGYTWHHNETPGKMELVDSKIHAQTGHTGGKEIWGGGRHG
ncbi:MAG: HNH endonuclease [Streptococcaceae bacterium]|jgi:hypothetical protein|nr:HNH endonuclease [Streptococcaceae bacterium]